MLLFVIFGLIKLWERGRAPQWIFKAFLNFNAIGGFEFIIIKLEVLAFLLMFSSYFFCNAALSNCVLHSQVWFYYWGLFYQRNSTPNLYWTRWRNKIHWVHYLPYLREVALLQEKKNTNIVWSELFCTPVTTEPNWANWGWQEMQKG
jgi:hypothetical protein